MSSIPEGATKLCMEYTLYHEIDLPEDLNREDIVRWWVQWSTLHIEMKDGTVHEYEDEVNTETIDWKRGHHNLTWVDANYCLVSADEQEGEDGPSLLKEASVTEKEE